MEDSLRLAPPHHWSSGKHFGLKFIFRGCCTARWHGSEPGASGDVGRGKKKLQQGLEPWTPRFFRSETSFSEREIGSLESRKCMLETEASEGAEVQKYLRMLYPLSYTDSVRNVIKTTIVSTKLDVSGKRSQKSLTEHQRDKSTRHISTFSGICRALPFRVSVPFPRKCCRSCSSAPLAVDFAACSLWLEQMPGGCSVGVGISWRITREVNT